MEVFTSYLSMETSYGRARNEHQRNSSIDRLRPLRRECRHGAVRQRPARVRDVCGGVCGGRRGRFAGDAVDEYLFFCSGLNKWLLWCQSFASDSSACYSLLCFSYFTSIHTHNEHQRNSSIDRLRPLSRKRLHCLIAVGLCVMCVVMCVEDEGDILSGIEEMALYSCSSKSS